MANENKNTSSVAAAEGFLNELKQRAEAAHKANDVFMMSLMTELITATTPIVKTAINRYHREERARINALHKELREKARAERERARAEKSQKSQG